MKITDELDAISALEFIETNMNLADIEFVSQQKYALEKIALVYRIPCSGITTPDSDSDEMDC